jgi:hypothetical protein
MMERIRKILKSYISVLNMRPEVEISERIYSPKEGRDTPLWIHLLLFFVTLITTTIAGASSADSVGEIILTGLPFSLTIISILLSHEMGHYLAARYFGVKATLPYFIPFPSIIGTMGAVIKIKSRIKDKRALLYIGASGPLIGFVLSLIASIVGIYYSEIKPLPAVTGDMTIPIFGDSLLFSFITTMIHGNIPAGYDIYLSPYAWAGWIGFLVTSLNLMPMGQLDGSHILYSLIGEKQLVVGWITFLGLVILSFIWIGWILWIIMALLFLMIGHPHIDEGKSLTSTERFTGWSCVFIFFLTFIPVPVTFLSGMSDARVYPIECEECRNALDPSGIAVFDERVLMVSDNDGDWVIYEIVPGEVNYRAREYINFRSGYDIVKRGKREELDLEGLALYKNSFLIVDERDRKVLIVSHGGLLKVIDNDINRYSRRVGLRFSSNRNAGFEGIAVDNDKGIFFIANEREPAVIFLLRMRREQLMTIDHLNMEDMLRSYVDISDLLFYKGSLYAIHRHARSIVKIDPYKKIIRDSLFYGDVTKGLYSEDESRGFVEGLYINKENILLLLDSNGRKMNKRKYGQNGALIIMKRPKGF